MLQVAAHISLRDRQRLADQIGGVDVLILRSQCAGERFERRLADAFIVLRLADDALAELSACRQLCLSQLELLSVMPNQPTVTLFYFCQNKSFLTRCQRGT